MAFTIIHADIENITFDKLDSMLLHGSLDAAKIQIEQMYRTRSIVTSPAVVSLMDHEKIWKALNAEKHFSKIADTFEASDKINDGIFSLRASYLDFNSALSKMSKSLSVSKELAEKINGIKNAVFNRFSGDEKLYKAAETMRDSLAAAKMEESYREQREEEASRQAANEAEEKEYERQEQIKEQKIAAQIKARKVACGDDYGTPRIGMSLERAQQCVGKFTLVSQLNKADGIVSTYEAGSMYLHVMDKKIVAWGRY
jgi:hypothetical protein